MSSIRRRGKRRFLGIPALVVAITLFIAACGDDATPTLTTGPGATATPTVTPAGDTAREPVSPRLKISMVPPALVQTTMIHPMGQTASKLMPQYEYLVGNHHKTGEQIPQIATEWSVGPGADSYRWNIRKDVPFIKDGKPNGSFVTAKDIILSWELTAGANTDMVRTARSEFGNREVNARIVNDHELDLQLAKVSLDFPFLMSDQFSTGIVSKDHWDAVGGEDGYFDDPIGTGPWSFIDLDFDERVLHERVQNHWRKTPEFHEVEVLFIREAATRYAMLVSEEVHITGLTRLLGHEVERRGLKVERSTLPANFTHINIHYYKPENFVDPATGRCKPALPCGSTKAFDPNDPLRDVRVREALNLVIDRQEINEIFYNGEGTPYVSYAPQSVDWFQDRWAPIPGPHGRTGREGGWPYPHDPARAKQLMIDAGYENGFEMTLVASSDATVDLEQPEVAAHIIDIWERELGIEVDLDVLFTQDAVARWRDRDDSNIAYQRAEAMDPPCRAMGFGWYESGAGIWDYQAISDYKNACDRATSVEELDRLTVDFIDWWLSSFVDIPLLWLLAEVAIDPAVVREYQVNLLHIGPIRYHEYTVPVYK